MKIGEAQIMKAIKRPLKKSILIGCSISFLLLCLVLTLSNYISYRSMLYHQFENHIRNVLTSTECDIDVDDLEQCIKTGVESPKYYELQKGLDKRKDNSDIHFLYIIIPLNTNETDNVQNVIAAMSKEEYAENPEYLVKLNSLSGSAYLPTTAAKYLEAYEKETLCYFEETSEWGDDFTGMIPLYNSKGEKVAALCADIDAREIHGVILRHVLLTIALTLMAGTLFTLMFLRWANKSIIRPIEKLEKSVSDYTGNGLDSQDPNSLRFEMPDIHTDNEVESLAKKIVIMSEALQITVNNMLNTEQKLVHMSIIAHKDALTQVGNKTAYKDYIRGLQKSINEGTAEFAIVMSDVNRLKYINDTFGHEKGDIYIKKCCSIICGVYSHSPVFRIGGDEFIVILTGNDYEHRDELIEEAREKFEQSSNGDPAKPWKNCSMAIGMAVFDSKSDKNVQSVLDRADKQMYIIKKAMHQSRS